ncbi:hypothetical protein AAG906_020883 [Vitis piasezkii]
MYGSILEERHFDVDWSPIIEDLYSPELGFMDICVARLSDAPTPFTVHSSRPLSVESLREGCIPEGMIASARDLLKSTHIHLEPPSPRRSSLLSTVGQSVFVLDALLISIQIIISFVLSLYRILIPLLALASLRQEIGGQQGRPPTVAQDETPHDSLPPPPPPPIPSAPQASPYVLHGHFEIAHLLSAPHRDDAHALRDGDIERHKHWLPRFHLRLYSTVMRAHGLDDGATQQWFASLESSRRRTWGDLAREFLRQFSFNTVVDIASMWWVPLHDFGSLVMALYDVEDDISRGLWTDSSPSDIKGKKPFVGPRPADVSAIGSSSQRPLRRHQPIPQFSEPHSSYASHQALRDPRSPTRPQATMLSFRFTARLRRLIPTQPSRLTPFALRTRAVLVDRHAVESSSWKLQRLVY